MEGRTVLVKYLKVIHPGARIWSLNWDLDAPIQLDFKSEDDGYWVVLQSQSPTGILSCYVDLSG
jgi:hypothetical protein